MPAGSTERVVNIREALVIFNPTAGRARGVARGAGTRTQGAGAAGNRVGIGAHRRSRLGPAIGPGGRSRPKADGDRLRRRRHAERSGNGLAGSPVPLALLPAGTANVFAKELGLPWNIERAASLIGGSRFRRISLGHVKAEEGEKDGRYFLSLAGAGPDGAIVRAVNPSLKDSTGTVAFWIEGFRQLTSYRFPRFRVKFENETAEGTLHHRRPHQALRRPGQNHHSGRPLRSRF